MNTFATASNPTFLELVSVLISMIWIFVLPGYLWSVLCGIRYSRDWGVTVSMALGIGMAFWPVLLLWTSAAGISLAPAITQGLIILLGAAGFLLFWFRQVSNFEWRTILHGFLWAGEVGQSSETDLRQGKIYTIWIILFTSLSAATFWTRFSHTKNIVLPNWVDSVHHGMIVRLIIDQGQLPKSVSPFLPEESQFAYHWGYHALVAWLAWARGAVDSFDAIHLMLLSGQVWSMCAVLILYATGRIAFGSRQAGFWVAVLGGLVSWFPAYYISWGRYTHLAGVIIIAPAAISLWKTHVEKSRHLAWVVTTGLLAAGLILIHIRVAFFFVTLALVLAIYLCSIRAWGSLGRWVLSAAFALLLCIPWIWQLLSLARISQRIVVSDSAQEAWAGQNSVTWQLLWVPGMNELLALTTAGLSGILKWGNPPSWISFLGGFWLIIVVGACARHTWRHFRSPIPEHHLPKLPYRPLCMIAIWTLVTALIINLDILGLPTLGFMTNDAAVISLFAPVSMVAGGLVTWVLGVLIPQRAGLVATLLIGMLVGGWGSYQMRDIVNPTTTLVHAADIRALHWIREYVEPDARFAVHTRRWLGSTYAGTDAGYWLPILSQRASILPASLYITSVPRAQAVEMNQLFAWWSQVQHLDAPDVREQLQAIGVTHLYLGANGGHLVPEMLTERPYLIPIYEHDGVQIFKLAE